MAASSSDALDLLPFTIHYLYAQHPSCDPDIYYWAITLDDAIPNDEIRMGLVDIYLRYAAEEIVKEWEVPLSEVTWHMADVGHPRKFPDREE